MKTRQIHGLGLGEFLIFAPAKEMLKSAYFFSALVFGSAFLCLLSLFLNSRDCVIIVNGSFDGTKLHHCFR